MKSLLAAVTLIGLSAVAAAVFVGLGVFDGEVVDDPYERGIAWDEERRRRAASGLETSIAPGPFRKGQNDIVFRLSGVKGQPVKDRRASLSPGKSRGPFTTACLADRLPHSSPLTSRSGGDRFLALAICPLPFCAW